MDAVGLTRGRSHAIPPWPDQKAHEATDWVAKEALAILAFAISHTMKQLCYTTAIDYT